MPAQKFGTFDFIDVMALGRVVDQHADVINASGGDYSLALYNVVTYGADPTGVADSRIAIQAALTAATAAGGGQVWFPAGIYTVSRNASQAYSLLMANASNVTLVGVRGQSWIRHPAGMPNAQVNILELDECNDCRVTNLGFDGNWGNAVTRVALLSNNVAVGSAGTINVWDTSQFPASGTLLVLSSAGVQTVTYTSKTATTFLGCSGGSGTLNYLNKIGLINSQAGGNHTTQADPKNHQVASKGCINITIDNCRFKNAYGDFVWLGQVTTSKKPTINTKIVNCDGDVSARDGVDLAQHVEGLLVQGCRFENIFSQAMDSEPVNWPVRDVTLDGNFFGAWWSPISKGGCAPMSVVGSAVGGATPGNTATRWRVTNNFIEGTVVMEAASDIVFEGNHITLDWPTTGGYGIRVYNGGGDVSISYNTFYSRCLGSGSDISADDGTISVLNSAGTTANVVIHGNRIRATNAHHGIKIMAGGGAIAGFSGNSTSIGDTQLVSTGAGWTTNAWASCLVRVGTAQAFILSNTLDTLTLVEWGGSPGGGVIAAWGNTQGSPVPTPSGVQPFTIVRPTGWIDISHNQIDLTDDGNGPGKNGIYLTQANGLLGMRLRAFRNTIRNPNGAGIHTQWHSASQMRHLELVDNVVYDDQPVATATTVLEFAGNGLTPNVAKLIMRGNAPSEGLSTVYTNLATSTWLEQDGNPQIWTGFGAPGMTAPKGSTYKRLDGGAGTTLYVNETGTNSWRAV